MELVKTIVDFPIGELSPLIKKCFNQDLNEENYDELVIYNLFPRYYQFMTAISFGKIVIAKSKLIQEEHPPMLTSFDSLLIYKIHLKNSKEKKILNLGVLNDVFRTMVSISYHGYEIMEFEKKGVEKEDLLKDIFDNSMAYHYWSLLEISEGRRIGCINYKNGKPDLNGDFHEFDMQRFLSYYKRKEND